jgi:hypothetical protein
MWIGGNFKEKVMRFERRLKMTPYHWSANIHIIPLLERAGDWTLDRRRPPSRRHRMLRYFTFRDAFEEAVSISHYV